LLSLALGLMLLSRALIAFTADLPVRPITSFTRDGRLRTR
jgi:hypothetical protein